MTPFPDRFTLPLCRCDWHPVATSTHALQSLHRRRDMACSAGTRARLHKMGATTSSSTWLLRPLRLT